MAISVAQRNDIHTGGDFGDFGVSFVATVAGRYTRRGGPRLSVRLVTLVTLVSHS